MRKRLFLLLSIVLAFSMTAAACSKQSDAGQTTTENSTQTSQSSGGTASSTEPDPFGKYDPPIEVTTVRQIDASYKFAQGQSLDNNIWTPIFKNELGITVKNLWVVDASQYHQKLNVSIASGDLPDIFEVNQTEMQRLIDADQIEDLTKLYQQYASPFTKSVLNTDNASALKPATVNGKMMAIPIPSPNGGVSAADMIWVRTDWLKKLNLPAPKTMNDVYAIAEAFAKDDPDGDGKADTIGLGISKELYDSVGSIKGFLNGFHAYSDIWVKDGSGHLVYSSIQPQMKQALQKLQDLYKEGVLDKELAVKSWSKVEEDIAAGHLGLVYGNVAVATSPGGPKANHQNDPKAQWQAYPIVSVDDATALAQIPQTAESFYVIKKGSKHPEAPFKLLNVYLKKFLDTPYATGSANPFAIDTKTNIFPAKYAPVQINIPNTNLDAWRQVMEAFKNHDGSKLSFPASLHYERNVKFQAGDDSMWFSDRTFGKEGSFSVINTYDQSKHVLRNEFTGAPTPTMVEKGATLQKMEDELFTKIIMNASPIDDFDQFVNEWKRLGGDDMTKEVNDWYAKNKQ